jgi:hypothetical protein
MTTTEYQEVERPAMINPKHKVPIIKERDLSLISLGDAMISSTNFMMEKKD